MFSRSETLSAVGRSRSFISVDDAIPLVNQFDKCKNIPVTYKIPDSFFNDSNSIDIEGKTYTKNTFYNVPGTKAILNTGTGKIAGVVSPRYNAINHSDAFDPIIQGIKTCSESVMINIENDRDIVRLECLFKDHKIHDDSNEGIIPGFKFTSGYDGKTSIKGEFYGLRLACLNGMTLKTIVNGITLNIRHLEKATETIEYIHDFINKILSNIEYIETVLKEAKITPMTFEDESLVFDLILPIVQNQKDATTITSAIPLETNRYDFYNALTEHASHSDITRIKRDKVLSAAEKFLTGGPIHYELPKPALTVASTA